MIFRQTLPPRKVYPELLFRCARMDPVGVTNFVLDKYELEPCALTKALADRKDPNECWQVSSFLVLIYFLGFCCKFLQSVWNWFSIWLFEVEQQFSVCFFVCFSLQLPIAAFCH